MRTRLLSARFLIPAIALGAASMTGLIAAHAAPVEQQQLARAVLAEMVAVRSVEGRNGSTEKIARMAADRFLAAGFSKEDVHVLEHAPGYGALVVRYPGDGRSGKKPIMLMAHIDVVDALREDWPRDPFTLTEEDGYFYGRGTNDNKGGAAALVATLIALKQNGFVPSRDLVLVLSADEETNGDSISWLMQEHRDLVDAEFALNTDGGGGNRRNGEPVSYAVQASEKVYMTVTAAIRDSGGHSSIPNANNAIYRLARALVKLGDFHFPAMPNEVTRGYFGAMAGMTQSQLKSSMKVLSEGQPGSAEVEAAAEQLSTDNYYRALLRTTCVATMLRGGHAENALPQLAEVTINCRMLPGHDPEQVRATLLEVMDDDSIEMNILYAPKPSPASPLRADIMEAVRTAVDARYPGLPIVPTMSTGASDGVFVRNAGIPTYGLSGLFGDMDDNRAHGQNERIGVDDFYAALDHWRIMIEALATD